MCSKAYQATAKYFYRRAIAKDGLTSACKKCLRIGQIKYSNTKSGKIAYGRYAVSYPQTITGKLRRTFACMKQRCNDHKHYGYKRYGGRGIKVCFASATEFVNYVIDELQVDPRGLTVDRIDNNGNYERGNIRFATHKENCNNK